MIPPSRGNAESRDPTFSSRVSTRFVSILVLVELEFSWWGSQAFVASIRGVKGSSRTGQVTLHGRSRSTFAGQARRCGAPLGSHERGSFRGWHPTAKAPPSRTGEQQAVIGAEQGGKDNLWGEARRTGDS